MGSSSNRIICAICYEEARPASEDLQSISLCGHVFHELWQLEHTNKCVMCITLSLQQWLEYCPRGRKCTCPLCKQQCSEKDIHRLFFQSAIEASQTKGQSDPCEDIDSLQESVQKLTGQLSVVKSSLEASKEQLSQLNRQLTSCTVRAEKAEFAQAEANREKASLKDTLLRIKEELKRTTSEQCKLLERNTAMAKELASHKLTQDLDVDEGELTRLARVGCVNKDDVIGTLTRSLMMRNRAYKELMARCNELGMGESKALRKSEKAIERIKQLKARVQQLEKCIEVKENRDLHHSRASSFPGRQDLNSSCDLLQNLSQRQNITRGSKSAVAVEPLLDITDSDRDFLSHGVLGARIYLDKVKQMSMSGSKKFGSTSVQDDDMQIFNFTESAEVEHELGVDKTVQVTDCDVENDSRKDSGGSLDVVSEHKADNPIESLLSLTIRNERRALVGSAAAPESHPFRKLAKEVSGGNKWCKQSAFTSNVHNGGGDLSSGTYISFGANGRGGQVKVLKPPPMLKIGGNPSQTLPRPVKRCKSLRTAQHAGNRQGALQIEHFFGSSAT